MQELIDRQILQEIKDFNNTVYVFIGNDLRKDDGAGIYIVNNIHNNKIKKINAGSVFENYINEIILLKPQRIVIFDAAFFGKKPGSVEILDEKNIKNYKMISTHTLPLNVFLDFIKEELKDVKIIIIGIQIKDAGFGEELSEEVKKSCDKIINFLNNL